MRISLKDLLAVVTFCAVVSWCAGRVGYDNPIFWIVAAFAAVMATAFVATAGSRAKGLVLFVPLIGLAPIFLMIGSMALLVNAGLLLVAGIVTLFLPRQPLRMLWSIALGSVAISFVWAVALAKDEIRRLEALRQEYPIVSLADRLQYERRQPTAATAARLNTAASNRLAEIEQQLDRFNRRAWKLEMIHRRQHELFVRAVGFGVGRMIRPTSESLAQPPLRDIPFDADAAPAFDEDGDWYAARSVSGSTGVAQVHAISRADFVDPEGFGAVIEPITKVTGFLEHAFHAPPLHHVSGPDRWSLERLELVSLLKFDQPRVYVLDHLPRMDELSGDDVPTRPLNEFETQALAQLQTTEDVVVANDGPAYRMLGSLRAARQCLDCHAVQRGELLGAFSYRLRKLSRDP